MTPIVISHFPEHHKPARMLRPCFGLNIYHHLAQLIPTLPRMEASKLSRPAGEAQPGAAGAAGGAGLGPESRAHGAFKAQQADKKAAGGESRHEMPGDQSAMRT